MAGCFTSASVEVQSLLAMSSAFRNRVGAATENLAKQKIYRVMRGGVYPFVRPYGLVMVERVVWYRGRFGSGHSTVLLEDNVPLLYRDDPELSADQFTDWVGEVAADLMEASESSGALLIPVNGIQVDSVQRSSTTEPDDYMQARILVEWGLR